MTARIDGQSVAALAAVGLLAHPSAASEVVERFGVPGSPDPARVLLSRVLGGLEHEVLASRGLDIGYAAWRGVPLAWRSPVSDARALDRPSGADWLFRFTGGLLATCGPFSIGADDGEHGLHGDFSHRPATRVASRSHGGWTQISGTIEAQHPFGPSLTIDRTIESDAGEDWARLTLTDRIENTGPISTPLAMLYHLNFGPPLAVPGSTVAVDAEGWTFAAPVPEVPTPVELPEPCRRVVEAVAVYDGVRTDQDGWAHAILSRPGSAIQVDVAWRPDGLPYLHQWIYPTAGRWALAIEPSTAPLFGPDFTAPGRGAPVVPPGGTRVHEIMITVREAA